jgi:short-subunit dehydrogenase
MSEKVPTVWITGATSGIGRACAKLFASHGYCIAASGRDEARLESLLAELDTVGARAIGTRTDVGDEGDVINAYEAIIDGFGHVDVLINNAGIAAWGTFTETTLEEFDESLRINVIGYLLPTQQVLADMKQRKSGDIVNVLSVASRKAFKNGAAYNASKFAALGFTDSLREEVRKDGIRVLSVFPGATVTPMWDEDELAKFSERMIEPDDVARSIYDALQTDRRATIEEIVIRPIGGDL